MPTAPATNLVRKPSALSGLGRLAISNSKRLALSSSLSGLGGAAAFVLLTACPTTTGLLVFFLAFASLFPAAKGVSLMVKGARANGSNGKYAKDLGGIFVFPRSATQKFLEEGRRFVQSESAYKHNVNRLFYDPGDKVEIRKALGSFVTESNKYILVDKLASGGMGSIYVLYEKDFNRLRCLKISLQAERFEKERLVQAEVEEALKSEVGKTQIARVPAVHSKAGNFGVIMDYVEGVTVEDAAAFAKEQQKAIPGLGIFGSLAIYVKLMRALDLIHSKGMVHRDVKPANIMLVSWEPKPGEIQKEEDIQIVLLDLGIVKVKGSQQTQIEGFVIGTPGYVALSQLNNSFSVGPGADKFSAGVILYEMLTGKKAFPNLGKYIVGGELADEHATEFFDIYHNLAEAAKRDIEALYPPSRIRDGLVWILQNSLIEEKEGTGHREAIRIPEGKTLIKVAQDALNRTRELMIAEQGRLAA